MKSPVIASKWYRGRLARIVGTGVFVVALGVSVKAYLFLLTPNNPGLPPAPNRWANASMPVPLEIDPNGIGGISNGTAQATYTDIQNITQTAIGRWMSATGGALQIRIAPWSGVNAGANEGCGDGHNTLTFSPPAGLSSFEAGTLAITLESTADAPNSSVPPSQACRGANNPANLPAGSILDADIIFNASGNTFTINPSVDTTKQDLGSVITHELGHWNGMEHTGIAGDMMYPYAPDVGTTLPGLASDDSIGIDVLYNGAAAGGGGVLTGTVRDQNGNAIVGAHVVAVAANVPGVATGTPVGSTVSVPTGLTFSALPGNYEIDGLPPGSYVVYAEPLDKPVQVSDIGGLTIGFSNFPAACNGSQPCFNTAYH